MAQYRAISMEAYDDLEAGFSGHSASPLKPAASPRRPGRMFCDPCDDADVLHGHSASPLKPAASPRRPGRMFCDPCDDADVLHGHHHYLDICFRCRKLLAGNRDIFMYRGDMPFCSEECRQEQIEIDEGKEQRSKQTGRAEQQRQRQQKQSPHGIPVWAR